MVTLALITTAVFTADLNFSHSEWTALTQVAMVTLGVALLCFVVGELTNNNSQVELDSDLLRMAFCGSGGL
jgi:hypothetical protein